MPTRIQRKRSKGWRAPANCLYVGRPTRWGNPFPVGSVSPHNMRVIVDAEHSVQLYRQHLEAMREAGTLAEFLDPLRGAEHLSCWCGLDTPCHVDVLVEAMTWEV